MTVAVIANALAETQRFFEQMPDIAEQAAVFAINTVATREALPEIRKTMRSQIEFPGGYLESGDRLTVARKAAKGRMEAVIRGRDRATSLARFRAPGQTPQNTRGFPIKLAVKRGQTALVKRGFLVTLRNGNIGLAVRLKKGETLKNSDKAVQLANNVYLLYGPSVDQVFRSVAGDVAPAIKDSVTTEFFRQFARLTNG
jgi:hypothetical protein